MKNLMLLLTVLLCVACGKDGSNGSNGTSGNNGSSCFATPISGGTQLTCNGFSTIIVNGSNGSNGTSCTVAPVSNGSQITCGGNTVTVPNGTNGTNGTNGLNGTNCSIAAVTNGATITCGANSVFVANGPKGATGAPGSFHALSADGSIDLGVFMSQDEGLTAVWNQSVGAIIEYKAGVIIHAVAGNCLGASNCGAFYTGPDCTGAAYMMEMGAFAAVGKVMAIFKGSGGAQSANDVYYKTTGARLASVIVNSTDTSVGCVNSGQTVTFVYPVTKLATMTAPVNVAWPFQFVSQ